MLIPIRKLTKSMKPDDSAESRIPSVTVTLIVGLSLNLTRFAVSKVMNLTAMDTVSVVTESVAEVHPTTRPP
jgi:hypothetical protein